MRLTICQDNCNDGTIFVIDQLWDRVGLQPEQRPTQFFVKSGIEICERATRILRRRLDASEKCSAHVQNCLQVAVQWQRNLQRVNTRVIHF